MSFTRHILNSVADLLLPPVGHSLLPRPTNGFNWAPFVVYCLVARLAAANCAIQLPLVPNQIVALCANYTRRMHSELS